MADRDTVAVDLIGLGGGAFLWGVMGDDLVAMEVEVDPLTRRFAPFRALKNAAIETPRSLKIIDRKREMKTRAGDRSAPR